MLRSQFGILVPVLLMNLENIVLVLKRKGLVHCLPLNLHCDAQSTMMFRAKLETKTTENQFFDQSQNGEKRLIHFNNLSSFG
jgi:hypothetical protein